MSTTVKQQQVKFTSLKKAINFIARISMGESEYFYACIDRNGSSYVLRTFYGTWSELGNSILHQKGWTINFEDEFEYDTYPEYYYQEDDNFIIDLDLIPTADQQNVIEKHIHDLCESLFFDYKMTNLTFSKRTK